VIDGRNVAANDVVAAEVTRRTGSKILRADAIVVRAKAKRRTI
jgi:hypothetical protein